MLFNSFEFIFIFLPIMLFSFIVSGKFKGKSLKKINLLTGSLIFYSYWDYHFTPIFILSISFNYLISKRIQKAISRTASQNLLTLGIIANLSPLIYYKYTNFIFENINTALNFNLANSKITLPLAISFYTFQQIAYLVDCFKEKDIKYNFVDYSLFVSFFPQLIAGPIVHHSEIMPQIEKIKKVQSKNVIHGFFVFLMGLFKKVVIADTLATIASLGFDSQKSLTFYDSWVTSISYTLQLYFDFSGYSDMAIGLGLIFGVNIPINFNSPYKSRNIQEFWKRWHITLSKWLRDYIYIPLGGNRLGTARSLINIFITFLIGGIWHGAGWTYVVWGVLHGLSNLVFRLYGKYIRLKVPTLISVFLTFLFCNIAWVYFRAKDIERAHSILNSMFSFENIILPKGLSFLARYIKGVEFGLHSPVLEFNFVSLFLLLLILSFCFLSPNSNYFKENFKYNYFYLTLMIIFSSAILFINDASEFIYFQF